MKLKPKISLEFLKNNKQVIFSVAVIIMVPALVVFNAYYLINSLKKSLDREVYSKAIIAAEGLNVSLLDNLYDSEKIDFQINKYQEMTDEIEKITITKKNGEDFTVIASTDENETGKVIESGVEKDLYVMAWYKDTPFVNEFTSTEKRTVGTKEIVYGERFDAVTIPLKDANGEKKYLANIWISLEKTDRVVNGYIWNATLILIATIIVIIVLIFSNGRLFEYSILFNKLKEVDQMKDDFISIASHELRTPLTAIKGEIELLEDDLKSKNLKPKQKLEIMQMAQVSAKRLDELVADILDVSRIEQGRMKFEAVKTDIVEVARQINKDMAITAKAKKLVFIENIPKEKLFANIDPEKLKQVLVNIIGNAIKYTQEGEVEVKLAQEDELNKIIVRDTGFGMDEEERKNLFTKFYRVQNESTKEITGTGLGLWITKQIVEQMGGKIMVDSIKGVGTEFTVTFPIAKV